jgi:hypothetical protein
MLEIGPCDCVIVRRLKIRPNEITVPHLGRNISSAAAMEFTLRHGLVNQCQIAPGLPAVLSVGAMRK